MISKYIFFLNADEIAEKFINKPGARHYPEQF